MKHYKKYLIRITDKFEPHYFSAVTDEVEIVNKRSESLPLFFKSEILISFLQDHPLQSDWVKANPELADLVTSGTLFTGSIESLFESCTHHSAFRLELENYLKEEFRGT